MNNNNSNHHNHLVAGDVYNETLDGMGSYHALHNKQHDPTEVTIRMLDSDIVIRGYRQRVAVTVLVWLLILATAGMLGVILLYWKPDWMLKLTHYVCPLTSAQLISIEDPYQQKYVRKLYTAFASTASTADAAAAAGDSTPRPPRLQQIRMFLPTFGSPSRAPGKYETKGVYILGDDGNADNVTNFRWFRFQKHKYFWDTANGTFRPLVGPSSMRRVQIDTQRGLSEAEVLKRLALFGRNEMVIKVASPLGILVLDVLVFQKDFVRTEMRYFKIPNVFEQTITTENFHQIVSGLSSFSQFTDNDALNPFYIFQVYSFIVWYTEGYIYYAWCIVVMSALSLIYTTWQTWYLQRMRRDRFQTSGTVQVIRHNDGNANNPRNGTSVRRKSSGVTNGGAHFDDISDETTSSALTQQRRQSYDAVEKSALRNRNGGKNDANEEHDIAQLPVNATTTNSEITSHSRRRSPNSENVAGKNNIYERTIESHQLVPGDIITIPSHGCELYCDAILLTGTCLVNEATLTGESVPVTKAAIEWHGENDVVADEDDDDDDKNVPNFAQQRLFYLSLTSTPEQRAAGGTSKNMLYSGTKIIQTRYYGNEPVKAVVMRTGYCTVKGELVRSILYPKPVDFSFHSDAMRFLALLAVFACIGMIYTFIMLKHFGSPNGRLVLRALDVVTIVVPPALPFAMTMGIVHAQSRLRKAGLFCISPRMINMAGSINLVCLDKTGTLTEEGLSLRGVIPLSSSNDKNEEDNKGRERHLSQLIPADALINTEKNDDDDDDERQPSPVKNDAAYSSNERENGSYKSSSLSYRNATFDAGGGEAAAKLPAELQICMATCHELTLVDGVLTGDPLDLEMFRATGWELEEPDVSDSTKYDQIVPTIVRPPASARRRRRRSNAKKSHDDDDDDENSDDVSILRVMSFESKLQRMSVIVRRAASSTSSSSNAADAERFCVCAKGAPEKIASLCVQKSLPQNFNEILTQYANNGDRVLALAYRTLDAGVKFIKLQRTSRDALERELIFLGFIVFENRLKPQTLPCIRELKAAKIRPVMVTGDNLLTALSVARQCNIIDTAVVSLLDVVDDDDGRPKLRRQVMATAPAASGEAQQPAHASQTPISAARRRSSTLYSNNNNLELGPDYCCAVTGDTFQTLRDAGKAPADYYNLLHHGAVFARMTPAQKELLVEDLRHAGYFVGMCGDGANDCGALKTAHMGISLSDQEASAAAPYTYRHANVSCVPTCIKEGRAALDTSFGAFKYMAAYSLAQFLSVLILYATNTNLSDFDFLYIDLFQVTLIVIVFGLTKAAPVLVKTPPPSRLLSVIPLLSLLLQMLIVLGIQVAAYLLVRGQTWFVPTVTTTSDGLDATNMTVMVSNSTSDGNNSTVPTTDDGAEHYFSYQNYAVFTVSTFQYVWLAIAFSRGLPYRRLIFTNWMLTLLCLLLIAFDAYLVLKPCSWLIWLIEIKLPPTWHFRWVIIGLTVANFLLAILCEWWIIPLVNRFIDRRRRLKDEWHATQPPAAAATAVNNHHVGFSSQNDLSASSPEMEMERVNHNQ